MTLKRLGIVSVVVGLVAAGFFGWRVVAMVSEGPQGIVSGPVELTRKA